MSNVPSNDLDLINFTILNTPKPQASSTVERKNVYSVRNKSETNKQKVEEMDLPTRDTDAISTKSSSSRASSLSSLGILSLDNVEDIQEYLSQKIISEKENTSMSGDSGNLNKKLKMQRLLAQKVMEKVDTKSKTNPNGLPSYLLAPTVSTPGRSTTLDAASPMKNESTVNLSDLEKNLPKTRNMSDQFSFEEKEISARSSSFGKTNNKSTDFNLKSTTPVSDFTSKYQTICNRIRKSDINIVELCDRSSKLGMQSESLKNLTVPNIDSFNLSSSNTSRSSFYFDEPDSFMDNLQHELFTSGELAAQKMQADEISWRKAKDELPVTNTPNNHLDLSCFSGYIGDTNDDSKVNEKLSFSDFFKRRSEDMGELDLKSSPEKKHHPVPLIDVSNLTTKSEIEETTPVVENSAKNSDNRLSMDKSILSATAIAKTLSKMDINETPSRVLETLMQKVRTKSSAFKATLKENQTNNSTKQSKDNKLNSSNNDFILRDSTNFQATINVNENNSKEIIEINSDEEWMDANQKLDEAVENNETISSITESPSYSCSELEFSDDHPESENCQRQSDLEIDNWIIIEQNYPIKVYTFIDNIIPINIKSKTNHWLNVKLNIGEISSNNTNKQKIAEVQLENQKSMLKSFASEQFKLFIKCLTSGIISVVINIKMVDMITKTQKNNEYILHIEVDSPKLNISTNILDFELLPESANKTLNFKIRNDSNIILPLLMNIKQDHKNSFMFATDSDSNDAKVCKKRQINLGINEEAEIPIELCTSYLNDHDPEIVSLTGFVQIYLANYLETPISKVQLLGKVGLTKIQFKHNKHSCMTFTLGQTRSLQIRNSGVVGLELSLIISGGEDVEAKDSCFSIDTNKIVLKPTQITTVNITFNLKDIKFIGTIKRFIRLESQQGPSFAFPLEGVNSVDFKSPDVSKSPRISRSPNIISPRSPRTEKGSTRSGANSSQSSDSTGTLSSLQDGKLPIESTKTELVWGCVKPGKNVVQDFILRNRCAQRVRLQVVINGSGSFKLVKDHSESTSAMSLVLHSLESRSIAVSFSPSARGAVAARIMFLPIDQEVIQSKRQMIQLYGYGGYSFVDVQKVAKDTSGKMWLSFGRLDYRETLHQEFILRNTGSLAAFACLTVCCKVLYPFMDSSVKIAPTETIIEPNKEVKISVNFTPRPEDFKYIQKTGGIEVSEIASIRILSGPEPTRGRIRRLFNKISSANSGFTSTSGNNSIMLQLTSNFLVPRLSSVFEGEHMPNDVATICRENSSALRDLLRDIDTRDLILTIERDADESCAPLGGNVDDTCLFQSLVCTNGIENETTLLATGRVSGGFCSVEPRYITLTFPMNLIGNLLMKSHHSRPMPFEICISNTDIEAGVQVSPQIGVLPVGEICVVTINATKINRRLPYTSLLMIYVENEVMEIEVKIIRN